MGNGWGGGCGYPQIPTNRSYCPERNSTPRRTARADFCFLNLEQCCPKKVGALRRNCLIETK